MRKYNVYNFGERLAYVRKSKKITQQRLAEMIGVRQESVSNVENEVKPASFQFFLNCCNALDVTPNDLIGGDPE